MAKCRKKTNVPYILGGFGCIGVIATTIMAIQSTPKALELLEDAEKEKGSNPAITFFLFSSNQLAGVCLIIIAMGTRLIMRTTKQKGDREV